MFATIYESFQANLAPTALYHSVGMGFIVVCTLKVYNNFRLSIPNNSKFKLYPHGSLPLEISKFCVFEKESQYCIFILSKQNCMRKVLNKI